MINSHSDGQLNYFESEYCDDQTSDLQDQQALSPQPLVVHPAPELPRRQPHWFSHSSPHSKCLGWMNDIYDDDAADSAAADDAEGLPSHTVEKTRLCCHWCIFSASLDMKGYVLRGVGVLVSIEGG